MAQLTKVEGSGVVEDTNAALEKLGDVEPGLARVVEGVVEGSTDLAVARGKVADALVNTELLADLGEVEVLVDALAMIVSRVTSCQLTSRGSRGSPGAPAGCTSWRHRTG